MREGYPKDGTAVPRRAEATLKLVGQILCGEPRAPHLIDGAVLGATIGGRPADCWLRAALHYAARPHRLVWRAVAAPVVESSSSSTRVGPPLTVTWAPPITRTRPSELAPASD